MRVRTILVALVAVMLAVPMALAAPGAATAGGQSVDPSTLNPPIPPDHGNPVCAWQGERIVCHSTVPQPHDLGTFDSVIDCGSAQLSQTVHWTLVRGVAIYNADRNIVELIYVDTYTGSFSNPANGKSAPWTQQDVADYVFTTPGNNDVGTLTLTELQQVRRSTGGPVILTDAGTEMFSLPDYARLKSIGHHPIDDYFYAGDATGIAPLCAALS